MNQHMVEYKFRLAGVPSKYATKTIKVEDTKYVYNAKEKVKKLFGINPAIQIQFILRGKLVTDYVKFFKLLINPGTDTFTVLAVMFGG